MENKKQQKRRLWPPTTDHRHRSIGWCFGGFWWLPAPEKWLELCITEGICGSRAVYISAQIAIGSVDCVVGYVVWGMGFLGPGTGSNDFAYRRPLLEMSCPKMGEVENGE